MPRNMQEMPKQLRDLLERPKRGEDGRVEHYKNGKPKTVKLGKSDVFDWRETESHVGATTVDGLKCVAEKPKKLQGRITTEPDDGGDSKKGS